MTSPPGEMRDQKRLRPKGYPRVAPNESRARYLELRAWIPRAQESFESGWERVMVIGQYHHIRVGPRTEFHLLLFWLIWLP
ncbi:MAG: hypothetical protein JWM99_2540 [Verrucomicrobiales bacterium]|nr:hypothetical protein [Verrucomicrobiales bacterium]